jgi:malate synthase A
LNNHACGNGSARFITDIEGLEIKGPMPADFTKVLTPGALKFVARLERMFRAERRRLLDRRAETQRKLDGGWLPGFLPQTRSIRADSWKIAPVPEDLRQRTVEITGPVEAKMIINALNSGADLFLADFEDANAPTWRNLVQGQLNLRAAVRGELEHVDPLTGRRYRICENPATLLVRPRGWHLDEQHVLVDGLAVSASLFDFALFFFHNSQALIEKGSGPYLYLPKLENHLEARLWNAVFVQAQADLGIPKGTIKATVLIETVLAAFEMDEILWELREHAAGLNCGRWDYIFSFIKMFRDRPGFVLPDRDRITMQERFLRCYSLLLIKTCHRRGAHAMGGMAAQIPVKDDAARNEAALAKVRADKKREAGDGHDGTWVAHPGLVEIARQEFADCTPDQLARLREDVHVTAEDLLTVPQGDCTEAGLRQNVRVGILYLEAWLRGRGCVPIDDLMEDAATAEISRAQLWQWTHHGAHLDDGRLVEEDLLREVVHDEMATIRASLGESEFRCGRFELARELFLRLVLAPSLPEFLTIAAYRHILELVEEPAEPAADAVRLTVANGNSNAAPAAPKRFADNGTACPTWHSHRWAGIRRDFTPEDVERLRGSVHVEHTLADMGARRLWNLLHDEDYVHALGALSGNQAMQMVRAGLKAIYLSGWQVAADANLAGHMYPDQSLYPANSVPNVVRRINATLQRADQIDHMEGKSGTYWFAPIVADAEAGFGGPLNAFELMKAMIEAGAAGVHFEDQLASEKKCGHLGGKVLVPTQTFIRTLNAARLAADVMGVPTVLVARTDADAATLLTSDIDERDHEFLTGERTNEGFFRVRAGLEQAIARGLAYAPYADLVWCETSEPNLEEARRFAEAIRSRFPNKLLAYNCSPSFNWAAKLDAATIAKFQRELGAMGYKFQFVTLAGFHSLNWGMFELARNYRDRGMAAYSELQQAEFASERQGYTATRHQHEVGTGYFDAVTNAVSGGKASTTALEGSTEQAQFNKASA